MMLGVCIYCNEPIDTAHRDHVVPRSRGGPDTAANIVVCCAKCNQAKGDQLPSEWLGEGCPAKVLLIEARVNARLRRDFSCRDKRGISLAEAADSIAQAFDRNFTSPNVNDSNFEPANVVDAISYIGKSLRYLADSITKSGVESASKRNHSNA